MVTQDQGQGHLNIEKHRKSSSLTSLGLLLDILE